MYFHPQKGAIISKGKRYSAYGNKVVDVLHDEDGNEHMMDGTEITMQDHMKKIDEFIQKEKMSMENNKLNEL